MNITGFLPMVEKITKATKVLLQICQHFYTILHTNSEKQKLISRFLFSNECVEKFIV